MEFLTHVFADIIAALIVAGSVYLIQSYRYWKYLKKEYNQRIFEVYYKGAEQKIVRTVLCKVKRNIISYQGYQTVPNSNERSFDGEFIIDPINLKFGRGLHYHSNYDGFNFPKLIIKDVNTFYIETSYASNRNQNDKYNFDIFYQAYVWRRTNETLV